MNSEEKLQIAVVKYVKYAYPYLIINHHLGGVKLTKGQAVKAKSLGSCRAFPDLFIYKTVRKYSGLAIEIKVEGTALKKKNGEWATAHIKEQAEMIKNLKAEGYYATFAVGFDECISIIDNYLNNKL